jgi:hypothetical protein
MGYFFKFYSHFTQNLLIGFKLEFNLLSATQTIFYFWVHKVCYLKIYDAQVNHFISFAKLQPKEI